MRLSDKSLKRRTVISADGQVLGTVAELFVSEDWNVESIRIELNKDLADQVGAARSLFHKGSIEIPISFVQSVGDADVLAVDVAALRDVQRACGQCTTSGGLRRAPMRGERPRVVIARSVIRERVLHRLRPCVRTPPRITPTRSSHGFTPS